MTQIVGLEDERIRDRQTYQIIGAAMEVHRALGSGFLEPVYQSAFELELGLQQIPHVREAEMAVCYKETLLDVRYRVDFICFGEILVELKALHRLTTIEEMQIIHYLVASKLSRGMLLNFGSASLQFRRFAGPNLSALSQSVSSVKSVDPVGRKPRSGS
ncbi:MAG TPA: GxxExxY protein [Gemmatimonadales bacterium]|nr:GxxExxY protein [Gemmatimonadales bacterium]